MNEFGSLVAGWIGISLKVVVTSMWVLLLILGAMPLQQIRQINRVVKTAGDKLFWLVYMVYIVFAVVMFVVSMGILWK